MIPKANQRAGGWQLATHLLNEFDNDRVELADVRGAIARDLHGAFEEWEASAKATRCKKYLYSLSVNPDPEQREITRQEYSDYIDRVEKALNLSNQPRSVVFHVKYGREHCHVVWSRVDPDKGRAVQISHDRQKLRTVTQEFARDHGLELPEGMRDQSRTDRFSRRKRQENLAEKQQEERTGISKSERMAAITAAWRSTTNGDDFVGALEKAGYLLARGNKGRYVVVDLYGEVHALARQIDGAKTADVKARLQQYPVDKIPEAARAQAFAQSQLEKQRSVAIDKTPPPKDRRAELDAVHAKRRSVVDQRHKALTARHAAERDALSASQQTTDQKVIAKRLQKQTNGILRFLARITGISRLVTQFQKRQDRTRAQGHDEQKQALKRRHDRELEDFQRQYRALDSLEKREKRSLETQLRRDQLRARASQVQVRRPPPQTLTAAQREKLERIVANAKELTAAGKDKKIDAEAVKRDFNEAAARMEEEHERDERSQDLRQDEDVTRDPERSGPAGSLRSSFNSATRKGSDRDPVGRRRDERQRQRRNPGSDRGRDWQPL